MPRDWTARCACRRTPERSSACCWSRSAWSRSATCRKRWPLSSDCRWSRRPAIPSCRYSRSACRRASCANRARCRSPKTKTSWRWRWPIRPTTYTINAFEMVTGRRVRPQVAIPTELEAALERLYGAGKSALGQIVGDVEQRDDHRVRRRRPAAQGPGVRSAGDPPGVADHHQRARNARLRHPHRAVREPADRALPHRRRAARGRIAAAATCPPR